MQGKNITKIKYVLSWTFDIAKPYWFRMMLYTFIGILEVLMSLLFIWVSKLLIDVATGYTHGSFLWTSLFVGLVLLFQLLIQGFNIWFAASFQVQVNNDLRRHIFANLLQSKWNELEKFHTGDVLVRMQQDVNELVKMLTSTIPMIIITFIQLVGSFFFLFYLDKTLALVLVCIVPFFFIFSKLYVKKMRNYSLKIKKSDSKINALLQEVIQHRVVVKSFENSDTNLKQLDSIQEQLRGLVIKKTNLSLILQSFVRIGFSGGYLVAFLWGAHQLQRKLISFGTMTAFLQLVSKVQRPAVSLLTLLPSVITTFASVERLLELENLLAEEKGNSIILDGKVSLQLKDVRFSYDELEVLKDINMEFLSGTTTAIVGETGAGKTTLLRLMLAFVSPQNGTVLISNETQTIPVSPLTRVNFVYVPQGNTLFSGSIRDNLLIGKEKATDQELIDVLKIAAAEFVFELPDGMDTQLNEFGGGLSEGQAQRLAIARALLRPGKIFLFDEVTSALDETTEERIINNITEYNTDKTNIFITHRTRVLGNCDKVYHL